MSVGFYTAALAATVLVASQKHFTKVLHSDVFMPSIQPSRLLLLLVALELCYAFLNPQVEGSSTLMQPVWSKSSAHRAL